MFDELISGLQAFHDALPGCINAAINEREKEIIKLNSDQMYYGGIDAYGNPIYPHYQTQTVHMKSIRNQIPGRIYEPITHVALWQDGGFHGGMFIVYEAHQVKLWSEDEKTAKLTQKYGRHIFGLTDENLIKMRTFVIPILDRNVQYMKNEVL